MAIVLSQTITPIIPRTTKPTIAIVGEIPTDDDAILGLPFMGKQGDILNQILLDVGIKRNEVAMTYVFLERVPEDKIDNICVNKTEANRLWANAGLPGKYTIPHVKQGKYVIPQRLPSVSLLKEWLEQVQPNIVITLGPVAAWALLGTAAISKIRGTCAASMLVEGLKVLPTYSPRQIQAQWELRVIAVADFAKALRNSHTPAIIRPSREIWLEPTIEDLWDFKAKYIHDNSVLSVDIETTRRHVSCIGFSPSKDVSLVVPFIDERKLENHYWPTQDEEVLAMRFVRHLLEGPWIKLFQNGLYDIQYIWRVLRCPVMNFTEDSMLLHHSLQPELQKGLGFLGSLYTEEASWKLMYRKKHAEETKRDE